MRLGVSPEHRPVGALADDDEVGLRMLAGERAEAPDQRADPLDAVVQSSHEQEVASRRVQPGGATGLDPVPRSEAGGVDRREDQREPLRRHPEADREHLELLTARDDQPVGAGNGPSLRDAPGVLFRAAPGVIGDQRHPERARDDEQGVVAPGRVVLHEDDVRPVAPERVDEAPRGERRVGGGRREDGIGATPAPGHAGQVERPPQAAVEPGGRQHPHPAAHHLVSRLLELGGEREGVPDDVADLALEQ